MVNAKFEYRPKDGILVMNVTGHAGSGPEGFDTVCAGVSAVTIGIAQVISDMGKSQKFKKKPRIQIHKGAVNVVVKPTDEAFAETVHTLFIGEVQLGLLAQVYPEFVKLIPFDSSIMDASK